MNDVIAAFGTMSPEEVTVVCLIGFLSFVLGIIVG
jgi:hypothetical protein